MIFVKIEDLCYVESVAAEPGQDCKISRKVSLCHAGYLLYGEEWYECHGREWYECHGGEWYECHGEEWYECHGGECMVN